MKKKIIIIVGAVLGVLLVGFILIGIFAPPAPKTAAQPAPTVQATQKPAAKPTTRPTVKPTVKPVVKATAKPTVKPVIPTVQPTTVPVAQVPVAQPTQAPTTKQQVVTWDGKYGYIIQSLSNDLSSIGTDGTNNDVAGMNADCTQLQTDVATAQGFPAIPDAQTASDWSSGLTYLASGTQDCIDGTANYDAGLLSKAATEFDNATAKINAATNDIIALANQ